MKQKIALLLAAALLLCSGVQARRAPRHVAPRAAELNFAFLTDVHVTPRGESDSLLRAAVAEINASAVDFVLVTGDLCNMGSDAELHCVHGILKRLRKPWFAVPGNHETTWSESACTTFGRLFGNDGRLAFRAGGYLFVGFTAGPYMKMADGSVRREDLQWVEEQMRAARPGERIVTFCHYPLTNDVTNRTAVTQLLRRYDVRFDLCGHYHTLRLCNFDSIPGLMGRSLIPKNRRQEPAAGYNLVRVWGDSVARGAAALVRNPAGQFGGVDRAAVRSAACADHLRTDGCGARGRGRGVDLYGRRRGGRYDLLRHVAGGVESL